MMNVSFTSKLGKDLAQSYYALSKVVEAEKDPGKFIVYSDGSSLQMNKLDEDLFKSVEVSSLKDHGIENNINTDEFITKNETVLEESSSQKSFNEAFIDTSKMFRYFAMVLNRPTEELKDLNENLQVNSEDYGWIALANKYIDKINSTILEKVKVLTPKDIDEIVKRKND